MKRFLTLISIALSAVTLMAQELEGTYKNGLDSLAFSDDRAIFRITGFAGLDVAQTGEGSYEVVDDFLLIHTTDYSGFKSTTQALNGSREDSCVIKVIDAHNYPLETILVELRSRSGKLIDASVTDSEGKVYFPVSEKMSRIDVAALGYHAISFDHTPEKDFLVRLAENDIIEQRCVAFKVNRIDEERLSLLLLTDDFDTGKNSSRELKKLEKKAHKSNMLPRRLKKVYIPYDRKF